MNYLTSTRTFIKCLTTLLLIVSTSFTAFAEGTKQVMPNPANGTALYVQSPAAGPYLGAPEDNRLKVRIVDHTTENIYLGGRFYDRSGVPVLLSNVYYQIRTSAGVVVAGPTVFPTTGTGAILSYSQAVAGPNIAGTVPTGYTPFSFDPTANDEFYIEIGLTQI